MHNSLVKIAKTIMVGFVAFSLMAFQGPTLSGISTENSARSGSVLNAPFNQGSAADTRLSVSLPAGPFIVGQSITIPVTINTIPNTRGMQFSLSFNQAVLRCDSAVEGTFYSNWANIHNSAAMVFPSPRCNNTTGTVSSAGIFLLGGDAGGPNGSGVVLNYTFTILANGTSPITLTGVEVDNDNLSNVQALPITVENTILQVGSTSTPTATVTATATTTATPTVSATPGAATLTSTATQTVPVSAACADSDVNQDGAINVADLAIIGAHWNERGAPGWIRSDVVRDGVINVADLTVTGSCFGQNPNPPPPANTLTPTATSTGPLVLTPTPTKTSTATLTMTANPGSTPTATATTTATATLILTPTLTATPTITATISGATPTVTATFSTDAQMAVEPSTKSASVGQEFELAIMVTTMKASRGAMTGVIFNPAVLKCNSMKEGDFYSTWAASNGATTTLFPAPGINNTTGKVSVSGLLLLGGTGGVTGTGKLFVLKCTPLTVGTSTIELTNVEVDDDNIVRAGLMSVTTVNGTVNVSAGGGTATPTATSTVTATAPANSATRTPTRTPTLPAGGGLGQLKTNTPKPATALPTMQSGAHIGFDPAVKLVNTVGETFSVDVVLSSVDKPVRGIAANIKYNPQIIECSGVDEGSFLSTWAGNNGGSSMLFPAPKVNTSTGTISDGSAIIVGAVTGSQSAAGGPTGNGSFLKLTCKSKAVGVSKFTLENVQISGDNINELDLTKINILGVVIDSGEVFVGVTPTATAAGGSGSSSSTSTATPVGSSGGTTGSSASGTLVAGAATQTPGGPTRTPGIGGVGNAVEIPVKAGPGNQAIGELKDFIDAKAVISKDVLLRSQDGLMAVFLPAGVQALTTDNYPLKTITIDRLDQAPDGIDMKDVVGSLYDISPNGASFDPNAKLIGAIDSAKLPKGISVEQLTLATYDTKNKKWINLSSSVDKSAGSLSAPIRHFSIYALRTKPVEWIWLVLTWSLLVLALVLVGAVLFLRLRKRPAAEAAWRTPYLVGPVEQAEFLESLIVDETIQADQALGEDIGKEDLSVDNADNLQSGDEKAAVIDHPGVDDQHSNEGENKTS